MNNSLMSILYVFSQSWITYFTIWLHITVTSISNPNMNVYFATITFTGVINGEG